MIIDTAKTLLALAEKLLQMQKAARGDKAAIFKELRHNFLLCQMVLSGEAKLNTAVPELHTATFDRLHDRGFDFNALQALKIPHYKSIQGTQLESWGGHRTQELVVDIYEKIADLKRIQRQNPGFDKRHPAVRVNNIANKLALLTRHLVDRL